MFGISVNLEELIALKNASCFKKSKTNLPSKNSGNRVTTVRGRGMDFDEVRNYQAGDDIRHMEWRVTARTGRPHVKIYCEEKEQPVIILADFNPSMFFGTRKAFKSVVAARLAALLAWAAYRQGDKLGGLIYSAHQHQECLPRLRNQGVLPFLLALAKYTHLKQNNADSCLFSEALVRLTRVVRPGSLILLISDFYAFDENCYKHLIHLRQHNRLIAYHICDSLETKAPPIGTYPITNGKKNALLNINSLVAVEQYQAKCDQRMQNIRNGWHKLAIPLVQIMTDSELAPLILQTFPWRSDGR